MSLYRFLFAPVLLAVAVVTTSPSRPPRPPSAPPVHPAAAAVMAPAHAPDRASRVRGTHPGSVR